MIKTPPLNLGLYPLRRLTAIISAGESVLRLVIFRRAQVVRRDRHAAPAGQIQVATLAVNVLKSRSGSPKARSHGGKVGRQAAFCRTSLTCSSQPTALA